MISYFQDYVTIGAVLGFGLFLCVLLLGVASVLRPNKPYAEKLQVCLAAMDLGFVGEIPGLSAAQKGEVEADLVTGDIV